MTEGEYKIGALSALISGEGRGETGLFTTEKKQKEPEQKIKAKKTEENNSEDDNTTLPSEVVKTRKRKNLLNQAKVEKKAKLDKEVDEDEDGEEKPEYDRPSLGALVKMEDAKERIVDGEKEARTVFVGNLPLAIKEKRLRKIFAEFGHVETVNVLKFPIYFPSTGSISNDFHLFSDAVYFSGVSLFLDFYSPPLYYRRFVSAAWPDPT